MKIWMPFLVVLAVVPAGAQNADERAALLGAPQYVDPAIAPRFSEMTAEQLRESLKVVASRNYAFFGFNTPELQLHLPASDNSTYAKIEMLEPRLMDSDGASVPFELERGIHDTENQIDEIRFLAEDGEAPAEFARVVGEITLTYPLVVGSREIVAAQGDPVVSIDGPYVEIAEGVLAEAPSFSALEPIRAFDAQGRQLKTAPYSGYRMENDQSFRRVAFHGAVARVEVDEIASSVEVAVRYDVPISQPLPESRIGTAPDDERAFDLDPNARIEIEIAATAADLGPLPEAGETVPIPERTMLSPGARSLAEALDALDNVIPQPLAIVQLVVSPPTLVSISLDTHGAVKEWTWREGEVSEPRDVDTQWLECKEGMAADGLTLQRLPALWDDAARRVGGNEQPMQIVVGQYPCGVAYINVPFESRKRVQYEGDGRFVKVE